jgi:two-component sensor histidine kinase
MRPYNEEAENGERVVFTGDDVVIDDAAATPLALLFHELATNAAKYGGLATSGGHVTITGKADGSNYVIEWVEQGGPDIAGEPRLNGFGTRLVGLSVEGQMRGRLERRWSPGGLQATITVPLDALNRSSRLHTRPSEWAS